MQAAPVELGDLPGWPEAGHRSAQAAYDRTASRAGLASSPAGHARQWFEDHFTASLIAADGLLTGYYEPELEASLVRTSRFQTPVHRFPAGAEARLSRSEVEAGGLEGRGLEIAWLEHPVDAFLMQVQGCGRLRLPDGTLLRLGFAGKNQYPYRSIGAEMTRRGLLGADEVTARAIRDFVLAEPAAGAELLRHNPSYVYFTVRTELQAEHGPVGTMGFPLQGLVSAAVDPAFLPLGLPFWIDPGAEPFDLPRLWIAQDTGGAIKGPGRCDLFIGSGAEAGEIAGRLNQTAQIYGLWPRSGL